MKNIVTPLQVEWMVSTTERELAIHKVAKDLRVNFLGFFGNFLSEADRYRNVSVVFSGVRSSRCFADHSQADSHRLNEYDWELLPEFRDESGSLSSHRRTFDGLWQSSGICPNPSVYEVVGSVWAAEVSSEIPLRHYLVLGGDYNLEVLAERYVAES